jgi:hypothetical protein
MIRVPDGRGQLSEPAERVAWRGTRGIGGGLLEHAFDGRGTTMGGKAKITVTVDKWGCVDK